MNYKVIVGLGNPEKRYQGTRHNFGFMALEAFRIEHDPQAKWNHDKKMKAEICEVQVNGGRVFLLKPMTYMNLSGEAVKKFLSYKNLSAEDMLLIYDDIDLGFGRMKISQGGGTGGHKGVKSVTQQLGTAGFLRLRLGIRNRFYGLIATEKFVLQHFGIFEKSKVAKWLPRIVEAMECLLKVDVAVCQNRFH